MSGAQQRRVRGNARCVIPILFLLVTTSCGQSAASAQAPPVAGLRFTTDLPLPGPPSRFDYQSLDAANHRLYISHLGAGTVAVVDTQSNRVVADITDVPGAHGVLSVPSLGRVFAAATDTNAVAVIDPSSLRVIATVPAGGYPDGLAVDLDHRLLMVSDESGDSVTVIDLRTDTPTATIPLGGDVGNVQYDSATQLAVAGVQSRDELAIIDPVARRVLRRIATPGCHGPHGVQLAPDGTVAYVACEDNARLLAVDLRSGATTATQRVGDTPDVVALDARLGRLYVASESGVLSVFAASGSSLRRIGEGYAGPDAHSVAVDPAGHTVYLPLQDLGGHPMLREMAAI